MATQSELEQAETNFREMLDEEGVVVICGITFDRSAILRDMDPIGYAEALDNYLSSLGFDLDEPEDEPEERDYDAELELIRR
jgi:hypothetical protein